MAPRSNWKGYLKLSLVSCPVELYPATSTKERVAFHLLSRESGQRLKRRLVDPDTGEEVSGDDQVKGYALSKSEYVLVEEDEIASVAIESTHTIEIEQFVPRTEIDAAFLDTPYYLAPGGKMAEEAFAVIREAMRDKKVVGIGRVVLYRREHPIMLEPRGKGLVATTLRYAYEVRDDGDYFGDIDDVAVPDEMLDLATHIIGRKLRHFDPKRFEDRYQDALLDLIKAKQQHLPVAKASGPPKAGNVVSLMDALRKSIADEKAGASGGAGGKTAPRSKDKPDAKPSTSEKPAVSSGPSKAAPAKTAGHKAVAHAARAKAPARLKKAG